MTKLLIEMTQTWKMSPRVSLWESTLVDVAVVVADV